MECEHVQSLVADHLAGTLTPEQAEEVAAHLRGCAACAAEFEAAGETWQQLATVPAPVADSTAMRARFHAELDAEHAHVDAPVQRAASRPHGGLQFAAAAALLVAGVALGRMTVPEPVPDPQIADMRAELRDMREMVSLSLLQQPSASARLKGITWTGQIDQPGTDITAALLDTLRHDPNVPVRLASIDALKRFAAFETVRRGAFEALPRETSPMVQMALIDFVVEVNGREAAETLRRLSSDPMQDAAVRARAAEGLERVG